MQKSILLQNRIYRSRIVEFQHEMSDSSQHLRLALTVTHLLLVALGSLNVVVIFLILSRPYLRSITNVYMVGLCLADFIYLTDLSLVAATSLNLKSWPFGSALCHFYHGSETTGKYASVLFVVLLAADRYLAMCKSDMCARFRNYRVAVILSTVAWVTAVACSLPLYLYAKEVSDSSQLLSWYITTCSVIIFILPVLVIFYCYYQVFCKLREAAKVKMSKDISVKKRSRSTYAQVLDVCHDLRRHVHLTNE
ncbi:7 transmembrane receptor [Trichostrongylus colubriformis]|uniref:7 transmembrane receptor n=1 Tax=Trichostrongylus colubriformis TaxID=6319 RepID=A0AAN8FU98_TRICO